MQTQECTQSYDAAVLDRISEYILGERGMLVCPTVQFDALHAKEDSRRSLEGRLAEQGYFCAGTEDDFYLMQSNAQKYRDAAIVVNYSNGWGMNRSLYIKNDEFKPKPITKRLLKIFSF